MSTVAAVTNMMAVALSSGATGVAATDRSCGVCVAVVVQGKGQHRCSGSFFGGGDSPSDDTGDDDLNGSNDYG
ncbi:uncharacterized protein N7511_004643 [Penicillium nucicola]|uniref:uncharacterized protein n=1 Tax=Penicillium nucicola TaxID=1850975 RepID=UPI002545287D|nr:uncharacterized protein N7511_004643 [Penicillium nucicola]KAJ5767027.1 hypothetical protein N7511_004643 [Penicillium nucicola]